MGNKGLTENEQATILIIDLIVYVILFFTFMVGQAIPGPFFHYFL